MTLPHTFYDAQTAAAMQEKSVGSFGDLGASPTAFHSPAIGCTMIGHAIALGEHMYTPTEATFPPWQLEYARVIAFPASPLVTGDDHWWKVVAGDHPDDFVSTRMKHERLNRGTFHGSTLSLMLNSKNVSWLAQPLDDPDLPPGTLATLGPMREKLDWFVELLRPWFAYECPPLRRLALIMKVLQPAATQRDAFANLGRFLHKVNLEATPNDLLYQVNRRRNSNTVPGLQLNRVSTWSKLNIDFTVEPGKPFEWPERCYSSLELDMNTAPEWAHQLERMALPGLCRELADLAVEIADLGDIP